LSKEVSSKKYNGKSFSLFHKLPHASDCHILNGTLIYSASPGHISPSVELQKGIQRSARAEKITTQQWISATNNESIINFADNNFRRVVTIMANQFVSIDYISNLK
jgi:hypothetical protein